MKTKTMKTKTWKKSLTAAQQTELRTEMEDELRRLVPGPWSPEALQDLAPPRRRRGLQLLDALRRLDAGTYGTCHGCRLPISYVRLSVMPETTVCVDCSAARETSLRA